jgi:hypothetical protein
MVCAALTSTGWAHPCFPQRYVVVPFFLEVSWVMDHLWPTVTCA